MENKILEWIAWGIMASKYIAIGLTIVLGTQFVVYQGSRHKINPLKWLFSKYIKLEAELLK